MLPSTPQVESVYLDPEVGVLAGLKDLPADTSPLGPPNSASDPRGLPASDKKDGSASSAVSGQRGTAYENEPHTLLIDQTTLDPTFAITLAERVQSETLGRALMLDAPVSGGMRLSLCIRAEGEEADSGCRNGRGG